jgi:hypothetical protein
VLVPQSVWDVAALEEAFAAHSINPCHVPRVHQ